MKIIIAGNGKVGTTLTRELLQEGHDIILIDSNAEVLQSTLEKFDVMGIAGNCATIEILSSAGVKDADLLIAATNMDEVNILTCLTAHWMNKKIHTIARTRNPEYTDQSAVMKRELGLTFSINPEKQAAREISRILKFPGFTRRDTFAKGRVEIAELKIEKGSAIEGLRLMDLYKVVKAHVLVCAVLRDGVALIPDGTFIIEEGDTLFITASFEELTALLKNLRLGERQVNRVMICGGGTVSFYLAEILLKSGVAVSIIENKHDRCRMLADALPKATIIEGDGSSQALLDSEGIADCDAVISMTGMDELNMVISIYGNKRGVPYVVTKLDHMENSSILDDLPLGSIISPKELSANIIVRYVRAMSNQTGAAVSVHNIADGQVEALEFIADQNTQNIGVPLRNIKIKKNMLIACITHGTDTEIPMGNSVIQAGDTVIVVSGADSVIDELNDIFD